MKSLFSSPQGCSRALLFLLVLAVSRSSHAMTDAEEIEIGKSLVPVLSSWLGPILPASDPMARRVARVGAPFARLSKRRGLKYSYQVIANDKIPNAMAAPGGFIYITRKLVKMTANDAELAAILGHETAHIDKRHAVQRVEGHRRFQNNVSQLSQRFLGKGNHLPIFVASEIAYLLFSTGYAREKESEADAWGVRWMSQLGYHPSAIVTALGRIPHSKDTADLEKLVSNHPPTAQRQTDLQRLISQENLLAIAKRHGGPHFWLPTLPKAKS